MNKIDISRVVPTVPKDNGAPKTMNAPVLPVRQAADGDNGDLAFLNYVNRPAPGNAPPANSAPGAEFADAVATENSGYLNRPGGGLAGTSFSKCLAEITALFTVAGCIGGAGIGCGGGAMVGAGLGAFYCGDDPQTNSNTPQTPPAQNDTDTASSFDPDMGAQAPDDPAPSNTTTLPSQTQTTNDNVNQCTNQTNATNQSSSTDGPNQSLPGNGTNQSSSTDGPNQSQSSDGPNQSSSTDGPNQSQSGDGQDQSTLDQNIPTGRLPGNLPIDMDMQGDSVPQTGDHW